MAIPIGEAVHTKFFTPPEYQVELLNAAIENNIIACISSMSTKTFIVLKLIEELFAILQRKSMRKKLALFIAETSQNVAHYTSVLKHLTNYHIDDLSQSSLPINKTGENQSQVIIATSSQALDVISSNYVCLNDVNLLIVDDCQFAISKMHPLKRIMEYVYKYPNVRIFGMTYPLYVNSDLNPGKVEADLNELQKVMRCTVDTTSDIVSLLKYNNQPTEHLIECDAYVRTKLDEVVLREVSNTVNWIKDHRHDPSEIYDDEFLEDLKKIPDPNIDPLKIIDDFLDVLETMGPWCANKAALASLFTIEKLKVKTPYERHFLTLCTISTLMLKIRVIFDDFFSQHCGKELAYKFMSPKVKRLIQILLRYKPSQRMTINEKKDGENNEHVNNNAETDGTADNNVTPSSLLATVADKDSARNYSGAAEKTGCLTMVDTYLQYKHEKLNRWRARKRGYAKQFLPPRPRHQLINQSESVRGIIFVKNRLLAMVIHYLFADLKKFDDENFWWLNPQFTAEKTADPIKEAREAEAQHQKLEDALRKFRIRECNLLIGTSMLEEGFDLPRCNLTIRFNTPSTFRSYVYSKSKASIANSHFFILFDSSEKHQFLSNLAQFYQIQQLLLNRCKMQVDTENEQTEADRYNDSVEPFVIPTENGQFTVVKPSDSIACINRSYCAKLPSDAFTRLTPIWKMKTVQYNKKTMYVCSLRLPINSPFKKEIIGHPAPTRTLSKRIVALAMCTFLHNIGELDGNMQPIGKENFHVFFASNEIPPENVDNINELEPNEPRPGTNKRKQYYRKKVASCLGKCRPLPKKQLYFYNIEMTLSCEIPEEQNIRGRKIHPPEASPMSFGILLSTRIPKICPFPIYTRCGEVIVNLQLCEANIELSEYKLNLLENFLHYTFTKVLRLQKYYMKFDSMFGRSLYFIVPTLKVSDGNVIIDWEFVDEINRRKDDKLTFIPDDVREHFIFKRELYSDAVVMPWYRNQDVPQFFYVAEICPNLTPKSKFPGEEYKSFEEYYHRKYQLTVHDLNQPLLDVDHTSARLNFLTPRYVNRKGVALPTCSEATKKARRENLEQKQILVPELCSIHPFPASLWTKAVCLPCILYRINSLLLAEEIRFKVSIEINLGIRSIPEDFEWDALNFGWTLADVIRKTAELKESKAAKELPVKLPLKITELTNEESEAANAANAAAATAAIDDDKKEEKKSNIKKDESTNENERSSSSDNNADKESDEIKKKADNDDDAENNVDEEPLLEIGTWSNEMASGIHDYSPEFESNFARSLTQVRYGSPTRWMEQNEDFDLDSFGDCSDYSNDSYENPSGIRIEFKNDFLAEAHDEIDDSTAQIDNVNLAICWNWESKPDTRDDVEMQMKYFEEAVNEHLDRILLQNRIITGEHEISIMPFEKEVTFVGCPDCEKLILPWYLAPDTNYGITIFEDSNKSSWLSSASSHIVVNGYLESCNENENYAKSLNDEPNKSDNLTATAAAFSFDYQPDLKDHLGPSPSILLQALTMSNANDGLNLERLETIGDSFLKYAITTYLYCTYDNVHEGKLSHLRSKQVSNLNLYRLGKIKVLGKYIVAGKFEPHDNWLPPCFRVPTELEKSLIESKVVSCFLAREDLPYLWHVTADDITLMLKSKLTETSTAGDNQVVTKDIVDYVPFHLVTYQTIPDKSIADCVESLIGAYLIACGVRGAMLFVSWLGIKVLPLKNTDECHFPEKAEYGYLKPPPSPLLKTLPNADNELDLLLQGYNEFEDRIGYHFHDRSYLLQAMTHASYSTNRITDCYQRLEFLGDAVLDYLITRHLYEDKRRHSPGALTDLRSALVNNTIFASLAIRFGFHKFFLHLSPGLADVIHRFVRIQEDNGHAIFEEYYLIGEEECEEAEDVEVPKALGDIFESVAGAIYLDSGMSLDAVWKVYYQIMQNEIEQFSMNVPKSPIRELLELEPETAKFGRPEKLADGRRVRVTVEIFGKGTFKGIGRNYRIAKCTAAKCALKQLKKKGLLSKKVTSTTNVRGGY